MKDVWESQTLRTEKKAINHGWEERQGGNKDSGLTVEGGSALLVQDIAGTRERRTLTGSGCAV